MSCADLCAPNRRDTVLVTKQTQHLIDLENTRSCMNDETLSRNICNEFKSESSEEDPHFVPQLSDLKNDPSQSNCDLLVRPKGKRDYTCQRDCIVRFVKQKEKKQVTVSVGDDSKREYSRDYFLKLNEVEKRVCKVMFLNTLGISETWVTTGLSKVQNAGTIPSNLQRKHSNRSNAISNTIRDSAGNHINPFPKVPSHYIQKNSQKCI
ncbi:hypothetical protein ILUMI_19559 [Ignelater luminosus]|uniref:Uncharacterized protein n=1 Tax=Ignelater luminosus TaxID=2038154 RepID=A0A8K0CFZ2_IGNLU|nr:hypothetical protein ILUMI_19559 [Ignelater luminosus]